MNQSELNKDQPNKISKLRPVFDLSDFLRVVLRRVRIVYVFVLLTVVGSMLKVLIYIPTFTASTTINVTIPKIKNPFDPFNPGPDETEVFRKYLRYLRSNEFYLSVAQNLKFRDNVRQLDFVNPGSLSITKSNFWKNFYISKTGKTVRKESSTFREPLEMGVDELAGVIDGLSSATSDGQTHLTVSVTSLDPYTSMLIANVSAEVFVRLANERDESEATEVYHVLEKQLKEATEHLKQAELDLINFKKKNTVLTIDGEHKVHADRVNILERNLEKNRIEFEQNQKLIEFYENRIKNFDRSVTTKHTFESDEVLLLRKSLEELKRQHEIMIAENFQEDHWQLIELNAEIVRVATKLKEKLKEAKKKGPNGDTSEIYNPMENLSKVEELKKQQLTLETQRAAMQQARKGLIEFIKELPESEQTLINLERKAALNFELYALISKKIQENEIQRVSTSNHVSLGDLSSMPGAASRPNLLLTMIFSALIGIFLAIATIFVLEFFDSSVKSRQDLEDMDLVALGEVPSIAVVNEDRQPEKIRLFGPSLLVTKYRSESIEAQAFKYLRLNLKNYSNLVKQPSQTILVTSPGRQEGKSMVAANLAITSSQFDLTKRTLLIDCDFYNPTLSWYFGEKHSDGLISLLKMKSLLEDVVIRYKIPNLDVIPAGRIAGSPAELLGDEKFGLLLDYLKSEYSMIIIDGPPAMNSVESAILANLTDTVVMVASYRKTGKDNVMAAYHKITQGFQRRIYAVLNNVPIKKEEAKSHGMEVLATLKTEKLYD
jgi:polysaccharide biosynthesis transport protein